MALQPPRLAYYPTAEEAYIALQAHASAQGYGLAKYRSKPDRVDIRAYIPPRRMPTAPPPAPPISV
ncbi:uncharacterized protein BDZ99DRAFT_468001, partial [Mytilinidion resinicola]